jgi:hypothetical protein
MDQLEYYLYNCNQKHDVENNIEEIEIPEFTIDHINMIDIKYKNIYPQENEIICQEQNNIIDEKVVNTMNDLFDLNELYMEHVNNIKKLKCKMIEYNSIGEYIKNKIQLTVVEKVDEYMLVKTKKLQMYYQDIVSIIENDEENLRSVSALLLNISRN